MRRFTSLCLLCLLLVACVGPGNIVDHKAPDFTLDMVDGSKITTADLKGKPVLIYFFASW